MRRNYLPLFILVALTLGIGAARADLPNIPHVPPEVSSSDIAIHYDATTHLFTAVGTAGAFTRDGFTYEPIWDSSSAGESQFGQFSLVATINNDGELLDGVLDINGWVSGVSPDPSPSRLLLSVTVTDFGYVYFPPSYDPHFGWVTGSIMLGFAGSVQTAQGGDLASEFGGQDAPVGVIMGMSTMLPSFGFVNGFNESGAGASTHSAVPAPSSAFLLAFMMTGSALLGIVRSRRRQAQPEHPRLQQSQETLLRRRRMVQ